MLQCVFCEHENAEVDVQCSKCGASLTSESQATADESQVRNRILQLLIQGEKPRAVTAYRRFSGGTPEAAADYVDLLDQERQFAVARPIADVEWEVGKLLERGEKQEAIKRYQHWTGISLVDAQKEVETLEMRLGLEPDLPEPKGGCLGVFLLLGLGLTLFSAAFIQFVSLE